MVAEGLRRRQQKANFSTIHGNFAHVIAVVISATDSPDPMSGCIRGWSGWLRRVVAKKVTRVSALSIVSLITGTAFRTFIFTRLTKARLPTKVPEIAKHEDLFVRNVAVVEGQLDIEAIR